ncbi:MAG: hypothetical protein K2X86_17115 [Cytophagaceae bacterium]|nr:hypothetical protein [Cytophagaceae bacterium]
MNDKREIFDLIESYHQGLLSEEEKSMVEAKMKTDASFAEEVRISGLVNELVHAAGIDQLRQKMTQDLALMKVKRQTRIKRGVAAVIGLLLLSAMVYLIFNSSRKNISSSEVQKKYNISEPSETKKDIPAISPEKNKSTGKFPLQEKVAMDTLVQEDHILISVPEQDHTVLKVTKDEENKMPDPDNTKDNIIKDCNLSFDVIIHATCKGEEKGIIYVDEKSILGGTRPYIFRASKDESTSGVFSDLKEGTYIVTMYDSKGCSYSKEIIVPGKNCTVKKSYSFSPDNGETWKIPFAEGESGSFSIYNRAGISIFKGAFGGNIVAEWNGTDMQGANADAALYICILEYANGKSEKIEISVIR